MKKKELAEVVMKLEARAALLESRLVLVPENWGTVVEKFKELEAKISRIESLERQHTGLTREHETLRHWLKDQEAKLDNFKKRMTLVERAGKPLVEVLKEGEGASGKKNTG